MEPFEQVAIRSGHIKLDWLRKYRPFKAGIPRHVTIARVICRLKPDEIEQAFQGWISSLVEEIGGGVIAIDGKTARRSFSTKGRKNALHTVSAWSCQHQLVLGQVAVDNKTNEITAIPELLAIENSIITLDAMGCQREIAQQVVKQKADYILVLKGNHSGMQAELVEWWHKSMLEGVSDKIYSEHTEISSGHGRIETRTCQQLLVDKNWLDKKYQWSGLKSIIQITSEVHDKSAGTDILERRWYLSSLDLNSEQALNCVRSHWQVESMHWVLDMTFREDETKVASMKTKKKMAGLDDDYRSTLLEAGVKMR